MTKIMIIDGGPRKNFNTASMLQKFAEGANSVSDEMLLNADIDSIELFHIRGEEIKQWLTKYGKQVSNYAIIDDMDNMLSEQQSRFVHTNPEVGITEEDAQKTIEILNR